MPNGDTSANSMMLAGLVKSLLLSCFFGGGEGGGCCCFLNLTRLVKDPVGSFLSPEILS